MSEQHIGQLLDSLGTTADIDPEDMPTDALVILKVVRQSGGVAIVIGASETMDWVTQKGLLAAAQDLTSGGYTESDDSQ